MVQNSMKYFFICSETTTFKVQDTIPELLPFKISRAEITNQLVNSLSKYKKHKKSCMLQLKLNDVKQDIKNFRLSSKNIVYNFF